MSNYFLIVSGKTEKSVVYNVAELKKYILANFERINIEKLIYENNLKTIFEYRYIIHFTTLEELVESLQNFTEKQIVYATETENAFLFSGNGCLFPGVCKDIFLNNKKFREIFTYYSDLIEKNYGISTVDIIKNEEMKYGYDVTIDQFIIFCIQISLSKLLNFYSIEGNILVAHSLGEIVAAHYSGIINEHDTISILYHRAEVIKKYSKGYVTLSISESHEKVEDLIKEYGIQVKITAINSTSNCTVSGLINEIYLFISVLKKHKIENNIAFYYAAHIDFLKKGEVYLQQKLSNIVYKKSNMKITSSVVNNGVIGDDIIFDTNYIIFHLSTSVNFMKSFLIVSSEKKPTFIDISPLPVLSTYFVQNSQTNNLNLYVFSRKNEIGNKIFFRNLKKLYSRQKNLKIKNSSNIVKGEYPFYKFDKSRVWVENNDDCMYEIPKIYEYLWEEIPINNSIDQEVQFKLEIVTDLKKFKKKENFTYDTFLINLESTFIVKDDLQINNIVYENSEFINFLKTIPKCNKIILVGNIKSVFFRMFSSTLRIFELENPFISCKFISLDEYNNNNKISIFKNEIINYPEQKDIKYVLDKRFVQVVKEANTTYEKKRKKIENILIIGGSGGIGRKIIEKLMAKEHIKNIYVIGTRSREMFFLDSNYNNKVTYLSIDVVNIEKLEPFFVKNGKKLDYVFFLAGKVHDSLIDNIECDKMKHVINPKITGSWNVHILLEKYCINLKNFILFSSTASIIGNQGQALHAIGNSYLDWLFHFRKEKNQNTLLINWGAWGNAGYLNENNKLNTDLVRKGFLMMDANKCIELLISLIVYSKTELMITRMNWNKFYAFHRIKDYKLSHSLENNTDDIKYNNTDDSIEKFLENSFEEILLINIKVLNNDTSLLNLGFDSLNKIELINKIRIKYNLQLPTNFLSIHNTPKKIYKEIKRIVENKYEKSNISFQQKRWLLLKEKKYGERVVPIEFYLNFNEKTFKKAITYVVSLHEILLQSYSSLKIKHNDISEINILKNFDWLHNIDNLNSQNQKKYVSSLVKKLFKLFSINKNSLTWRIDCVVLSDKKFILFLSLQHIDFDGRSVSIFIEQLEKVYTDMMSSSNEYLTLEKPPSYNEYVYFQNSENKKNEEKYVNFYKGCFLGFENITKLSKEMNCISLSKKKTIKIENDFYDKLLVKSTECDISIFPIILLAYYRTIESVFKMDDIVISLLTSGRTFDKFNNTIGPFSTVLPLRARNYSNNNESMMLIFNDLITECLDKSLCSLEAIRNNLSVFKNLPDETYFSDFGINYTNYKTKKSENYKIIETLEEQDDDIYNVYNDILYNRNRKIHLVITKHSNSISFSFHYQPKFLTEDKINNFCEVFIKKLKICSKEA